MSEILFFMGASSSSADTALNAFDRVLINIGCANYNLVRVSSILPSNAILTDRIKYDEGALLPTAYARLIAGPNDSSGIPISAAIAVGIPKDRSKTGVIMEYSGYCEENIARSCVEKMVKTAMKDRNIQDYDLKLDSSSMIHDGIHYSCVFALLSIMF